MASGFVCSHPRHKGDRQVRHPNDQYSPRIEYRRADGMDRPHSRQFGDLCRECMERYEWPALNALPTQSLPRLYAALRELIGDVNQTEMF